MIRSRLKGPALSDLMPVTMGKREDKICQIIQSALESEN